MITVNKSLLSTAVDSVIHAIDAVVDAADAIAAIAIDIVEQVIGAIAPVTVQQQANGVESLPQITPQNDQQQYMFVPVIWHRANIYEVFTSKWDGEIVESENLTELALRIEDHFIAEDGEVYSPWVCGTAKVAIMRAKDAIREAAWGTDINHQMRPYAIKIPQ